MKALLLPALAAVAVQLPLFALLSLPPLLLGGGITGGDLVFYVAAVLLVATSTVLLVGLPVFALMRRFGHVSMRSLVLAGLVIGALPVLLLGWPLHGLYGGYSASGDWFGHAVDFYKNGAPTFYAWLDYVLNMIRLGIHGMLGAVAFHWAWRRLAA